MKKVLAIQVDSVLQKRKTPEHDGRTLVQDIVSGTLFFRQLTAENWATLSDYLSGFESFLGTGFMLNPVKFVCSDKGEVVVDASDWKAISTSSKVCCPRCQQDHAPENLAKDEQDKWKELDVFKARLLLITPKNKVKNWGAFFASFKAAKASQSSLVGFFQGWDDALLGVRKANQLKEKELRTEQRWAQQSVHFSGIVSLLTLIIQARIQNPGLWNIAGAKYQWVNTLYQDAHNFSHQTYVKMIGLASDTNMTLNDDGSNAAAVQSQEQLLEQEARFSCVVCIPQFFQENKAKFLLMERCPDQASRARLVAALNDYYTQFFSQD